MASFSVDQWRFFVNICEINAENPKQSLTPDFKLTDFTSGEDVMYRT